MERLPRHRSPELELGKAGQHLVCADLILQGYLAFLADEGLPYDVVCDLDGRLLRIQAKSTSKVRAVPQRKKQSDAYLWHVKRAGRGGLRAYGNDEFDLLALVATDIKKIAYWPKAWTKQTVILTPPGHVGPKHKRLKNIDQYPFSEAIKGVEAKWNA